jgi:hypothetical protein
MHRRIRWSITAAGVALAACSDSPTAPPLSEAPGPESSTVGVPSATYTDRAALLAAGPSLAYTTIDFATFDDGTPMSGQIFYDNQTLRGVLFDYFSTYYEQLIQANPLRITLPPNTHSVGSSLFTAQGPFSPPGSWTLTLSTGQTESGPLGTPFLGATSASLIEWVEINYSSDAAFFDDLVYGVSTQVYDFSGFYAPIDNLPVLNSVKAGSSIPVKFSLAGDQDLDIFAGGSPASQAIACASGTPIDIVEETTSAGAGTLRYDSATDQYTYVWKTEKSWTDTCRQLVVELGDGQQHVAQFIFR